MLNENILNSNFKNTIEVCFNNSDFFSLSTDFSFIENSYSIELKNDLEFYLLDTFKTNHWHCYYTLDKKRPLTISIYESNEKTMEIILKTFNNIFLDFEESLCIAEDICFFSNNKLFFGTVSHANMCNLYPSSNYILNLFLKYASWIEIEYLYDEHILLK